MNLRKSAASALFGVTLALGATATPPAEAQQAGLVNVNVSGITVVLADVLDVEENQIPVTVQAPIGIAAKVCNVGANVLAADIEQLGTARCDAEQTSNAFNNLVLRQLN